MNVSYQATDRFCSRCGKERAPDAAPFQHGRGKDTVQGFCPDCLLERANAINDGEPGLHRLFCSRCGRKRDIPEYLWPRGACCYTWSDADYYDELVRLNPGRKPGDVLADIERSKHDDDEEMS